MSFEKVEDFLGSNIEPKVLNFFHEWEKYVSKLSYFGGEMFCEILKRQSPSSKDDTLPLIMFFRNSIELVGSISSLLVTLYSEPAKIILRTLLETTLYIEYLTQGDTSRRSLSFLICQYHEKLNGYKRLQTDTQQNKQFKDKLADDVYFSNYEFSKKDLLQSQISNLESLIQLKLYSEVEKEYQRLKSLNLHRRPVWYEFFNGPKSIERLAYELKLGSVYEIIYRNLSKGTHGTNIIDGYISSGEDNTMNFSQIRFPYSAQMVCQNTFLLSLKIFQCIIHYYLPDWKDKFEEYYKSEIQDIFIALSTKKLLNIEK